MQTNPFGRTGLDVSRLGFGAAPVGVLAVEQDRTTRVVETLLDGGVNLIDTSACYDGSEALLADVVSRRRDEIVLVTKCGHAAGDLSGEEFSPALVTASVEQSLRRLRTDHLDVVLLHSCELPVLERGDALAALVAARDAGKVRHVGYSGDDEAAAHAVALPDVEVLQTSVNLADQSNLGSVLPAAREHRVGVMAKRPIANASWKPLASQPGLYADYAATYTRRLAAMGLDPAGLGVTGPEAWPRLALRFTLSFEEVHTAIVGTTNPTNVRTNLAALAEGPLPADVVARIRDAFRTAEQASGEPWTGQT